MYSNYWRKCKGQGSWFQICFLYVSMKFTYIMYDSFWDWKNLSFARFASMKGHAQAVANDWCISTVFMLWARWFDQLEDWRTCLIELVQLRRIKNLLLLDTWGATKIKDLDYKLMAVHIAYV